MKEINQDDQEALDELRRLLFGEDLDKIEKISRQIEIPENFSTVVSHALPEAIIKSAQRGTPLSESLVPTVEEILRLSIKKDINKFANALFPVIGPAIRKSISETMRQMMQSLNRTMEQSFSSQGLKWRLESMRSGIPISQIALLQGLVYRVEQVFLIHRETGLLLNHVEQLDIQNQNADLVSSMLTAINDFVGDSFELETNRNLGSIEIGDLSIWIEQGPDITLAIAIRGEAPNGLRTTMQQVTEELEAEYVEAFEEFQGDTAIFETSREKLKNCMQEQYREEKKKKSPMPLVVVILFILALLGWIGYESYISWQQNNYIAMIKSEPGYVITDTSVQSGVLLIRGLRDPLSRSPETLLAKSKLGPAGATHQFEPFQSLESSFVSARLHKWLEPPDSVSLDLIDGILVVTGAAESKWREKMASRVPIISGINAYDDSGLRINFNTSMINIPEGVEVQFEDGVLYASGSADQYFFSELPKIVDEFEDVIRFDTSKLFNTTQEVLLQALTEATTKLEKEAIYFDVATSLNFDKIDGTRIFDIIKRVITLSNSLNRKVVIAVRGHSDSVGSYEDNVFLSLERADTVTQALYLAGISPKYLETKGLEAPVPKEKNKEEKRRNRRVTFEVNLE